MPCCRAELRDAVIQGVRLAIRGGHGDLRAAVAQVRRLQDRTTTIRVVSGAG
jgi:hypothetical protein